MKVEKFISSIENKVYNQIRQSKSDAEARRYLKEHLHKQLTLTDVVDCLTDKEKIDYQIAQKRKESDDNMKGWLYALFFGLVIIIVGFNVLKSCSS